MSQPRIWIRRAALVVLLALVAVTTMAFASDGLLRTIVLTQVSGLLLHPPSDRDEFFNLVAVDFKQPALCDRIDRRADASTGGWGSPREIRTLRATCHSNLELPPNHGTSETPNSPLAFVALVRALGYTDADVAQSAYSENSSLTPFDIVYRDLLVKDEFRSRVRAATGYGEPRDPSRLRPAKPIEVLYQMVAVDAPEAALCSKISPNATFTDLGGAVALLQSRCYLHIAFNKRDVSLCEPLPASRSFPHINEIYDSREACRHTVKIYSRPDFKGNATYESTSFARLEDFQPALRELGYGADTVPPVPPPTADDYWEFVSRLIHRASGSDREEFVRRVKALK